MEQIPNSAATTNDSNLQPLPAASMAQPVSATRVPEAAAEPTLPCAGTPPCEFPELSPAQIKALEALAAGQNLAEAARCAGVHPGSIYRWKKTDPRFIAALNTWRAEAIACARDRVLALSDEAARAAFRLLRKDSPSVVLAILKSVGGLTGDQVGATDVDEAADTVRNQERNRLAAHRTHLWNEADAVHSDAETACWRRAANQQQLEKTRVLAATEPQSIVNGHRQADELLLEADGLPTAADVPPATPQGKAGQKPGGK